MTRRTFMTKHEMQEAIAYLYDEGGQRKHAKAVGKTETTISRYVHGVNPIDHTTAILTRLLVKHKREKYRATRQPKLKDLL